MSVAEHLRTVGRLNNVPEDVVDAAVDKVVHQQVHLVAFSGWLASGKDSVAEAVYARLGGETTHLAFAHLLKDEVNEMISICRQVSTEADAAKLISEKMNIDLERSAVLVGHLFSEANDDPDLNAYQRTKGTRGACQFHGTQVRRAQDENYWVGPALSGALWAISEGRHVYFTDPRFPNECDGLKRGGFTLVRLEITRQTQLDRLAGRGDPVPDDSVLYHESETALDCYTNWDLRVDNNGPFDNTVNQIVQFIGNVQVA